MRGPGEATGCFALESAIDELSYKLKMDPIQLRIKNFTTVNPENKLPFSDINIKDCYAYGMEKIGWKNRPSIPGTIKENGWLIGYGMSVGVFGAGKGSASVRIVLSNDGKLLLECAVSDMGPGTTTSMTMIAAEAMQIDSENMLFSILKISYPLYCKTLPDKTNFNRRRRSLQPFIDQLSEKLSTELSEGEETFIIDSIPLQICRCVRCNSLKIMKEDLDK
jgi:CO/xanthine dehydrogenase Mo-binding subunit